MLLMSATTTAENKSSLDKQQRPIFHKWLNSSLLDLSVAKKKHNEFITLKGRKIY